MLRDGGRNRALWWQEKSVQMAKSERNIQGYPINKYTDAERVDHYGLDYEESPVETELLDKLVMIAHANPYWLFDSDCEAFMAHNNPNDDAVLMGDEPSTYAPIDILRWIREGKPRITRWSDGIWTK